MSNQTELSAQKCEQLLEVIKVYLESIPDVQNESALLDDVQSNLLKGYVVGVSFLQPDGLGSAIAIGDMSNKAMFRRDLLMSNILAVLA